MPAPSSDIVLLIIYYIVVMHCRPSNVFILELFQLATRQNPYTRPLAWTALPIANDHFTVIHGKYRLPLLRGEHSPSVQQFKTMEAEQ